MFSLSHLCLVPMTTIGQRRLCMNVWIVEIWPSGWQAAQSQLRQKAIRGQSVATSRTMNFVMACKMGVESMSKGVCPSVEGLRPECRCYWNHTLVCCCSYVQCEVN